MKKAAIVANLSKEKALLCAKQIISMFLHLDVKVLMHQDNSGHFDDFSDSIEYYKNYSLLIENCDFAITIGGDGTIIHIAKYAAAGNKPLIGVNTGRLGFAAELEPDEISMLSQIVEGNFKIKTRMLLNVTVYKNDEIQTYLAVNDAVISRGSLSRIIDLSVYFNNENMANYHADGLLFSTPTGSTAYSLSAGGPVVEPQMNCILLTPVCPHSLFARSVIFDENSVLTAYASSRDEEYSYLTIDGQTSIRIAPSDKVEVKKAKEKLQLISIKEKNFYKILNEKLKGRES